MIGSQGIRRLGALALALFVLLPCTAAFAAELIMVETDGCSWCRKWHAEVGPGYARSTEGQRAPLRRVDIADVRSLGLTLKAPVTLSPTFILVERDREIGRITGYPGADFFWGLLDQLIEKLETPSDTETRAVPLGAGART